MRSSIPVIFAGISISHAKVRDLVLADVRPPVRAGDLDLLRGIGRIVAIIDGELAPDALLSASEIERAIGRGLDLRGSSSVGALRAAELRHRGMTGSGWVHRAFCTGWLTGTEEIAVLYDPRSFHPLTVPLVTVRFWLTRFVRTGAITAPGADAFMSAEGAAASGAHPSGGADATCRHSNSRTGEKGNKQDHRSILRYQGARCSPFSP